MSNTPLVAGVFAGIDVGKATLQLAIVFPDGRYFEEAYANTDPGRRALVESCVKSGVTLAVLEATGGLELDVASELTCRDVAVSVITPTQSRAFAKAMNQQAKTDAIDARLLAGFARGLRPAPSRIPSENQQSLRELAARRRQLIQQLVQEKNRVQQARDTRVQKSVASTIDFLESQIVQIDDHLSQLIAADQDLQAQVDRLDSVPAIGPATASQLIIACPELGTLNRQEIASLAGLAPFNNDSGNSSGKRHIRGGRVTIRGALFMATLTALRCNPVIKKFYQSQLARGKLKMVALTAAMRKLLIILNSMAREKKNWTEFIRQSA